MQYYYQIKYSTHNTYETPVDNGLWQFLIEPKNNDTQFLESSVFEDNHLISVDNSVNGYGFKTFKVIPKDNITSINFKASFSLIKNEVEININQSNLYKKDISILTDVSFMVEHHTFLKETTITNIPKENKNIFLFNEQKSTFKNLKALNKWVYLFLYYTNNSTNSKTNVADVIKNNKGIGKDFAHLFCAIARTYNIPTRFVSGFLNQDSDLYGRKEIHAWAECYIPNMGWIGFDPANNMLADHNHIKIAHGKDYNDCASLKGVVFSTGKNTTEYSIEVKAKKFNQDENSNYHQFTNLNLVN